MVVVVRAGGCGASGFACLVADTPMSLCVRYFYYFDLCYTGPCSSSLALVCTFLGDLGVYRVWGCVSRCI